MSVRYRSTRGGESVTFEKALLQGLAPDGGLYVPDSIPRLPSLASFNSSFPELGRRVLEEWIGDEIGGDSLRNLVHDALNFDVPLVPLHGGAWEGVHVLELFHGPTLSFKDFGARTMARLMGHFLERRGEKVTILVATSGDTGSAVADGFAGQEHIDVVLLYPKGKVSPTQERQLIVQRPGVRAFAVEGDFDDCQRMVKEAFVDPQLANARLSSANSINIGRLLPQMLYYVWAAGQLGYGGGAREPKQGSGRDRDRSADSVDLGRTNEKEVLFCVPSGNLGNLTAGVLAHLSGLPVRRFVAAHNANDFFPRLLEGEDARFAPTIRTLSNAMDVGAPSNFERLDALVPRDRLRKMIRGYSVTDDETVASIRRVYEETGYLADPHTAVGLEAVRRGRAGKAGTDAVENAEGPVVVLSTAHPAKFPEVTQEAVGRISEAPASLADAWKRDVTVDSLVPTLSALRPHLDAS